MKEKNIGYKEAMEEISRIMNTIENQELDIDNLSVQLKRITELIRICKIRLRNTEKEVEEILKQMDS